jgi:hypothetical protein
MNRRTTWRSALALWLLVVGCAPGPPRTRGPSYGPQGDPYLSPRVTAAIDRSEDPVHRLILIGDGGQPLRDDPTLAALGRWGDARPRHTTVLFLGDNVYPAGLQADDRARGEGILLQQVRATSARKIFVPGNHDWGFGAGNASAQLGTLHNEQRYIEAHASEGAEFLPRDGCPGPVATTLVPPGPRLRGGLTVLVVDFHWWLLPEEERPKCPDAPDTEAFLQTLRKELESRVGENVVVAAHHPLHSGGPHGGLTRGFWIDVGAGLYYRLYGPIQDLWEPGYAQMVAVVSEALADAPPLAYVAGHDHSLQILDGGDAARLMIVSGAGSQPRITGVAAIDETIFAHAHAGFVVLDFFGGGRSAGEVLLVRVVETGKQQPVFALGVDLARPAPPEPAPRAPIEPRKPVEPRK